jgi:hypothetical protein
MRFSRRIIRSFLLVLLTTLFLSFTKSAWAACEIGKKAWWVWETNALNLCKEISNQCDLSGITELPRYPPGNSLPYQSECCCPDPQITGIVTPVLYVAPTSPYAPTSAPYVSTFMDINGPCGTGIDTALGCIPVDTFNAFTVWFLQKIIGIAGGIAFLLIVFGGFKVMTSAGNPKGIQAGQEMISSALIGLLLIIFSAFLLELIGVKILNIPGLGSP